MECGGMFNRAFSGAVTVAHNNISATTTSNEIDASGFNAIIVSTTITGTGTWNISIQGRLNISDTMNDLYDTSNNKQTTGDLTTTRTRVFVGMPDLIKIVATEIADGATCTVKVQPIMI